MNVSVVSALENTCSVVSMCPESLSLCRSSFIGLQGQLRGECDIVPE